MILLKRIRPEIDLILTKNQNGFRKKEINDRKNVNHSIYIRKSKV